MFPRQLQYLSQYYMLCAGERDTILHIRLFQTYLFFPNFTLIPSTLTFLTTASICTSSTGFDFTVLGRVRVPQSDIISTSIKHSGKGDMSPLHNACLNIPTFFQTSTLILRILLMFYVLST